MSSSKINRIADLLNKNLYTMSFSDKKKLLPVVVTEEECDDLLIQFLARHFNIDLEKEEERLAQKKQLKKKFADFDEEAESDDLEEDDQDKEDEEVKESESIAIPESQTEGVQEGNEDVEEEGVEVEADEGEDGEVDPEGDNEIDNEENEIDNEENGSEGEPEEEDETYMYDGLDGDPEGDEDDGNEDDYPVEEDE